VNDGPTSLDKVIELVLTVGLALSGALLLLGLVSGGRSTLQAGVFLLMLTPLARVVVVTAGLFRRKDWLFALASLWILCVLLSSLWVGFRERGATRGNGTSPSPVRVAEPERLIRHAKRNSLARA
jgi:uncharacterized membrane protein